MYQFIRCPLHRSTFQEYTSKWYNLIQLQNLHFFLSVYEVPPTYRTTFQEYTPGEILGWVACSLVGMAYSCGFLSLHLHLGVASFPVGGLHQILWIWTSKHRSDLSKNLRQIWSELLDLRLFLIFWEFRSMTDPSNMIRNIMFGCQTMPLARWCDVKKQSSPITNKWWFGVWRMGWLTLFFLRMDVRSPVTTYIKSKI